MRRVYESSDLRGAKSPGAMRRMCGAIAKFSLAVRCSPFTKLRAEETTGARSSGWCRMIAATSSSNTSMAGGYICQGRQSPEATIDCALKLEGRRTMDARAQSDAAAIARAFKVAAHAENGCAARKKIRTVRVGHGPEIRNNHEPDLTAPLQGHFRPALRRSTHDRVLNVVKTDRTDPARDRSFSRLRRRPAPRGRLGPESCADAPFGAPPAGAKSSDQAHSITVCARGNIESKSLVPSTEFSLGEACSAPSLIQH